MDYTEIESLILKYIDGTASKEEVTIVEEWYSKNEDNKENIKQIFFIDNMSTLLHLEQSLDENEALNLFKKKIRTKQRKKRFISLSALGKYAAIFLLAFIASLLVQRYGLKNEKETAMVEIASTPGTISSILLPDNSKVWLNSMTTLSYPMSFDDDVRKVKIDGEVYFEVAKDENRPFIVEVSEKYSVEVLGTSFNISAYSEDAEIITSLISGVVKVNTEMNGQFESYRLNPKEKSQYNKTNERFNKILVKNIENDAAWHKGEMIFNNTPMSAVLKKLERHYNVDFHVHNKSILNSSLTAKFQGETLAQTIEYISLATKVKFKINQPTTAINEKIKIELF